MNKKTCETEMMVCENISLPLPRMAFGLATFLLHHASHALGRFPVTFGLKQTSILYLQEPESGSE